MINLTPTAGLGNRIRVIASVYKIAKENNVKLVVNWLREPGFFASYNTLFQPSSCIKINDHSYLNYFIYSKPSFRNLYIPLIINYILKRKSYYELQPNTLTSLNLHDNLYINTYCQQGDLYSITDILRPNKALQKKININKNKFGIHTIGIHIRRTDNIESQKTSSVQLFLSRIKEHIKLNDNTKFFLCTDDASLKYKICSMFPKHVITYDSCLNRNSTKGIQDAVIELWTLASTDEIWGSYYSSYTDMASSLFGTKLIIVK